MVLSLRETTSPTVARPASVSAVKALEVQLQALNQNIQKCKDYLDFRFSELESFLQNPPSTPFSFSTIQPPTLSLPPLFTSPTLHKQDVQMMTPTTASIESPFVLVPPIEPPPKPIVDNLMKNLEVVTPDVPVVDAVSKSDLSLPAPIKNAPQCRTLQSSKSVASTEGFKRVLHPMPIPAALLSSRQMLLEEDTYLQDQPQSELKCPPPPWNDNALMVFDKLPKPKVTLNCLMLVDALESLEKEHHANKEEKDVGTSLIAILVAASPDKRSKAIPQKFDPGGARAVVIEGENDRLMQLGSMTTHIYVELQSKSSDIPAVTWAINLEGRRNALIKGFDPGGIMSVVSSYEVLLLSDFNCSRMSSIIPRICLFFGVYSTGSKWLLMVIFGVQSSCWWFYWGRKLKFKILCGCGDWIWLFTDSIGEINAIHLESNAWRMIFYMCSFLHSNTSLMVEYAKMGCVDDYACLSSPQVCQPLGDNINPIFLPVQLVLSLMLLSSNFMSGFKVAAKLFDLAALKVTTGAEKQGTSLVEYSWGSAREATTISSRWQSMKHGETILVRCLEVGMAKKPRLPKPPWNVDHTILQQNLRSREKYTKVNSKVFAIGEDFGRSRAFSQLVNFKEQLYMLSTKGWVGGEATMFPEQTQRPFVRDLASHFWSLTAAATLTNHEGLQEASPLDRCDSEETQRLKRVEYGYFMEQYWSFRGFSGEYEVLLICISKRTCIPQPSVELSYLPRLFSPLPVKMMNAQTMGTPSNTLRTRCF